MTAMTFIVPLHCGQSTALCGGGPPRPRPGAGIGWVVCGRGRRLGADRGADQPLGNWARPGVVITSARPLRGLARHKPPAFSGAGRKQSCWQMSLCACGDTHVSSGCACASEADAATPDHPSSDCRRLIHLNKRKNVGQPSQRRPPIRCDSLSALPPLKSA